MSVFWKSWKPWIAFMISAIPIILLSMASIEANRTAGGGIEMMWGPLLFVAAVILWVIALAAAIAFTIARVKEVAVGIWTAVGITIIALGLSGFAMA